MSHGGAQREPLALATGQLPGQRVGPVAERRGLEQFIDSNAPLSPRRSPQGERQPDRVPHPKIRTQGRLGVLPEEPHQLVTEPRPGARWHPADVAAEYADDPG